MSKITFSLALFALAGLTYASPAAAQFGGIKIGSKKVVSFGKDDKPSARP